jgi:SAM-dependent methyltransferase
MANVTNVPPVIDYEGSGYRTEFWEGQGRNYEDATERLALQRLLPPTGRCIAEIGAGFGRLADLYLGYDQIVLFDYSRTLLQEAVTRWGHDPRFVFVAGNLYQLSLAKASCDALVMVRVMHHLADVSRALEQIRRVLHRESVAVVEYANKRNLKALTRWLLGRQPWSPLDPAPVEFVELNYDFHPAWMWEQFLRARLVVRKQMAVSHFRTPALKRWVPAQRLAEVDSWLFQPGGRYPLAPSVFVQLQAPDEDQASELRGDVPVSELFCCPACGGDRTFEMQSGPLGAAVHCRACRTQYANRDGIWDFKEPLD